MIDCLVLSGQEQARSALAAAVENFEHPAFPCALIMGDLVILELLHREGLLQSGRVPVIFVDTFHLFPETHTLLHKLEVRCLYNRGAPPVCLHLSYDLVLSADVAWLLLCVCRQLPVVLCP